MTTTPSARAREAAADLTRRHYPHEKGMIRLADTIASGHADSTLFAQAFARFEAEIRADERERCAAIAERWIEPIMATDHENSCFRRIATAIREPKP